MPRCAYRYRFYPNQEQRQMLARTFGCVRYVYNRALRWRSDVYHQQGETLRYGDTAKALTRWKQAPETAWLKEVSNVPLQQALRHLEKAYTAFFRGNCRFPRFKSKRSKQSASYMSNAFSLNRSAARGQPIVTLAKMKPPLKIKWSRPLPSVPVSLTITKDSADRYFISFRRAWACPECGAEHDRDVNAARNILAVGTTVIASGGRVRPDAAIAAEGFAR